MSSSTPSLLDYARPYQKLDLDETKQSVRDDISLVYTIVAVNKHASDARYLKLYDAKVADVTVGTTTPVLTLMIPANFQGFVISVPKGILFINGVTIACVTGAAVSSTGAPGADEVDVNIIYS